MPHIRGIVQGFAVWVPSNNDDYPWPSRYDRLNYTITTPGLAPGDFSGPADRAKDTTANIMSIMISNGFVPTEMLISPFERNPHIKPYDGYEFDQPSHAANPAKALWDPAFSVDFTNGHTGGLSYAHLQPSGGRKSGWANTFISTEACLSMRGPEVTAATPNPDGSVTPVFANPRSNTFGVYARGSRAHAPSWSGHVGFNDNHVDFLRDALRPGRPVPLPPAASPPSSSPRGVDGAYFTAGKARRPDLMFYDEPDDPKSVNDYLGIFIKAGEQPKDFTAIWD